MTTLQGMLAQTIHEDRARGYDDRTLSHRAALKQAAAANGSEPFLARVAARLRRTSARTSTAPAPTRP